MDNTGIPPKGRRPKKAKPPPQMRFMLRYYRVYNWPEISGNETREYPGQRPALEIPIAEMAGDLTPQTTIERDTLFFHPDVERYRVEHERRVHNLARFGQARVTEYNRRYEFAVYRFPGTPKTYMDANKAVAEGALRRLSEHTKNPRLAFVKRVVNVAAFLDQFKGRVDGAYFSNLKIMNVRAATISGDNVRESGEYEHYIAKGDLPAANIYFDVNGVPRRVTVTQDSLAMFYLNSYPAALHIADAVNDALEPFATYLDVYAASEDADEDEDSGDGEVPDDELSEGGDFVGDDL